MTGTRIEVTLPIPRIPPRMDRAVSRAMTPPTSAGDSDRPPPWASLMAASFTALAWTIFPIPNAARDAKIAKRMPAHFAFRPFHK